MAIGQVSIYLSYRFVRHALLCLHLNFLLSYSTFLPVLEAVKCKTAMQIAKRLIVIRATVHPLLRELALFLLLIGFVLFFFLDCIGLVFQG